MPASHSRENPRSNRRILVVMLSLIGAGAVTMAWPLWHARQGWHRLDTAADDFRLSPGFTEVARPRQGSGFCWVTCTNGGEAIVTIVLETDYEDPQDACNALRPAVVELTGDAIEAGYDGICGWSGDLGGTAGVFAGAAPASRFRSSGHRWTEAAPIPDSPVVAYVTFNSGLE